MSLPEDAVLWSGLRAHSFSQSTGIIGFVSSMNLSNGQSWSQPRVYKTAQQA